MNEIIQRAKEEYGMKLRANGALDTDSAENAIGFRKSSLNLLADEKENIYILKKIPEAYYSSTPAEIYFASLQSFMEQAKGHNIRLVNYLSTRRGKIAISVEEEFYVLYPYVAAQPYQGSLTEIASTAVTHAALNHALADMPPAKAGLVAKVRNVYLRDEPLAALLDQVYREVESNANEKVASAINEAMPLLERNIPIVENGWKEFPQQAVHKDLWPLNVLYQDRTVKVILDPDEAMYLPRIRDIAYSVWCFATRTPEGEITAPDLQKVALYVRAYLTRANLVKPEIEFLPRAMMRVWIEDFLNFCLNADFTQYPPGLDKKIRDLQLAVRHRQELESVVALL